MGLLSLYLIWEQRSQLKFFRFLGNMLVELLHLLCSVFVVFDAFLSSMFSSLSGKASLLAVFSKCF